MLKPTIHLNGTGRETLYSEYMAAYDAISIALEKVQAITCHGRDYYPQGSDAIYGALKEQSARMRMLETIKQDLEDLALHTMPER